MSWVKELTTTDKRVQGLKDFEWNETVTSEQKLVNRVRKLVKAKKDEKSAVFNAEKESKRIEYEAIKK